MGNLVNSKVLQHQLGLVLLLLMAVMMRVAIIIITIVMMMVVIRMATITPLMVVRTKTVVLVRTSLKCCRGLASSSAD